MSNEHRAKDQAYQEYLSLRENRSTRGNYVKDDELYGSYFPAGNKIEDTPYGASEMRQKQKEQKEQLEREQYLAERAKGKKGGKKPKPEKKPKKKGGRGLKIALLIVLILIVAVGALIATGLVTVKNTLDNIGRIEIDQDAIGIDPQVDEDLSNYRNIALLGIDARDMSDDSDVRSDAIIVISINKETGEIKMFSVYRDTMLNLGDDVGLDKITHAYYYGGPTKVLYTLNKNLDLNIKETVVVNWKSVADTVDALGGLEIEVLESEINELNYITDHTAKIIGGSDKHVTEAGTQTLNGNQAVAYARIRKDAVTGDYRRNERMKIVVKAAFEKAATMDMQTLESISEEILPQIRTNMSSADMMGMILDLPSYNMTDSVGWPYEVRDWTGAAFYSVPVTLEANVSRLHEEFFAQEGYVPTQAVLDISVSIAAQTGYY